MRFASAQIETLDLVIRALSKKAAYSKHVKHLQALSEKLKKLNGPKKVAKPGIGVDRAIAAMKSVLGEKLAVPRNPSEQWLISKAMRIRALGLTEDDCKKIGNALQCKWDPPYSFDYAINAADRLLAEAETLGERKPKGAPVAPVEMGDSWE